MFDSHQVTTITKSADISNTMDRMVRWWTWPLAIKKQHLLLALGVSSIFILLGMNSRAEAQSSQVELGRLCNPGAAAPIPVGTEWCEGVFRLKGISLEYLIGSELEISKHLPTFDLNYDSGYAGVNHHGVGAGWLVGSLPMIHQPKSDASGLSMIRGNGSVTRLIRHPKGHFYPFGGNPRDAFRVENDTVLVSAADGIVTSEYKRFKPNWFVLSSILLARPGETAQRVTIQPPTGTSPGSIVFNDGKRVSWAFSQTSRTWRFSGDQNDSYALITLDKSDRIVRAKAAKGNLVYDYEFTYDATGLMTSFNYTTAGESVPTTVVYNSSKAPYAIMSSWGTVRLSRRRDEKGNGILEVTDPNLVRTRYVYSPDRVLIEQRTYEVRDEQDLSKHWNVAFYGYGHAPDGRLAMNLIRTQRGGKEFLADLTFDKAFPTSVATLKVRDGQQRVLATREYTYHPPSGLLLGIKGDATGLNGQTVGRVEEIELKREEAAPFRVTSVSDLVSGDGREIRYEGGKQIEIIRDRNGEKMQLQVLARSSQGDVLLEHVEDLVGIGIQEDYSYDKSGRIQQGSTSSGDRFVVNRNPYGGITEVTITTSRGVRTTFKIDPTTDRVMQREERFPRGQSSITNYTYVLYPDTSIKTVTMDTKQPSGKRVVRRVDF